MQKLRRALLAACLVLAIIVAMWPVIISSLTTFNVEALSADLRNSAIAVTSQLSSRWVNTGDMEPIAHTDLKPYGINVFLEQEVEETKIRKSLQMIKDAGFAWVKQQVLWYDIEQPAKGQYYDTKNDVDNTWAKYDRIVSLCEEYGLELIARLDTSPEWARPGNSKLETPPDDFEDFGDFVYDIVSRYKGRVKYYQIWNEPNLAFEWGGKPVNAAEYTELLKIAHERAKEADPEVVIIAAALAPTVEVSERAINDVLFFEQMYAAGARDYFDIMSANPYGLRSGPYDRRLDLTEEVNFSRPMLIREVMVKHGDAAKPIWASETGWCALPDNYPEEPLFGRATREQQARYTVQAMQRAQQEWPWMGTMNLWHLRLVHDVNMDQQMYYFGILGNDFSPFPVYWAMQELANSAPALEYGYRQETHWALNYSGNWIEQQDEQAVLGKYRYSSSPGDSLSFRFRGTDLYIVTSTGPAAGIMEITVDGDPANKLASQDGAGRLDLYAPEEKLQHKAHVAGGLSNDVHEAQITVSGNKNPVSVGHKVVIDGIVVDRQVMSARRQAIIGGGTSGVVVVGLVALVIARKKWQQRRNN